MTRHLRLVAVYQRGYRDGHKAAQVEKKLSVLGALLWAGAGMVVMAIAQNASNVLQ